MAAGGNVVPTRKIVATTANFMTDVVEASNDVPVLVDFWAPWCGPCQALTPLLERIADEYDGRFVLAKLNTDEEPRLATHFQIRSIPTLMLVHRGEVVEQLIGAQPESAIRAILDPHVAPAGATPVDETAAPADVPSAAAPQRAEDRATLLLDRRDAEAAATAIGEVAAANPDHPALKALQGRLEFVRLANAQPDVVALRTALEANPADSAARLALGAHYAVAGDYATALGEWLELMRRDRTYGDEAARRSLLQAFDVLGEHDPLVAHYRRRMASLLH
jgi:putative thioredoxin